MNTKSPLVVQALKFTQWLDEWDNFAYSPVAPNRKPRRSQFFFSMKASVLRSYSDVYKRKRQDAGDVEGIQRQRDEKRTKRIQEFVKFGYPYGDLRENQRTEEKEILKKPGWLPTAIVINILEPTAVRRGKKIKYPGKVLKVHQHYEICLPDLSVYGDDDLRPFEVIDGQHRLWAFEEELNGDYELPVVAFQGLDIAWQAYLFWSINVSPKRINPSHAFDLYPLLRNQAWLEQTGDLTVYREARAQEITEWLYKHSTSVWQNRINMLGESGAGRVSQAAFVRSLATTFFGTGRGQTGRHGLFQASVTEQNEPLAWDRSQQVAFVLEFWRLIKMTIEQGGAWVEAFLSSPLPRDPLEDKSSLLNQDMGVRAVHAVVNDIMYKAAETWGLVDWVIDAFDESDTSDEDIECALRSLKTQRFYEKLVELASALVSFDWRSLDGPGVRDNRQLELTRRAYRGSGGYTLLTLDIIRHLSENGGQHIGPVANKIETRSGGR